MSANTVALPLRDVRVAGALMLGAAAAKVALGSDVGLPCPLRTLTGVPCPLCGMTTSVAATVRGDLVEAFTANPAGPAAVATAMVLLVVIPRQVTLDVPRWALPAALVAMWLWELGRFHLV